MGVDLIGSKDDIHFSGDGWSKVVYLALRYGWKPAGTKAQPGVVADVPAAAADAQEEEARRTRGFNESDWFFSLDATHGIPPEHPLAYCSQVMLFCDDPLVVGYFLHRRVLKADARALAAALEKALPHLPEGPEIFRNHKPGALFSPGDWAYPGAEARLREIIAFCKRGGFRISP